MTGSLGTATFRRALAVPAWRHPTGRSQRKRMVMNPAHAIHEPGEPFGARRPHGHTLSLGTRLRDYEITGLIREGAFSIVYLAWDDSLQRTIAIKEYMPASMASRVDGSSAVVVRLDQYVDTFKAGLKSFIGEARLLARFDHASLVKVYRFWEEKGTAYMVMPFYEGPTLQTALAELGHVPGEAELRTWLKPILSAVTLLHEGGLWHQNISPDGIVLTPVGPVLFGFGAAEKAIAALDHMPAAHPQSIACPKTTCGRFLSLPPACTASVSWPPSTLRSRSSRNAGHATTSSFEA